MFPKSFLHYPSHVINTATHRCFRSPVERPSEPDRINGLGIEEVAALRLLLQRLRRALQPVDV